MSLPQRRTIHQVHRRERGEEIYPVELRFDLPGPPMLMGGLTEVMWEKIFKEEAEIVYQVLCRSLPAGTAERFRALVERRGASGWSMARDGWTEVPQPEQTKETS
jgi:hypothetical protein